MENICRFKKRMVYPEKLILDQLKLAPNSATYSASWCNGACDKDNRTPSTRHRPKTATPVLNDDNTATTGVNRQFIQDRIRHLVDAFSTRAHTVRERMEVPTTPSSLSSHDSESSDITVIHKSNNAQTGDTSFSQSTEHPSNDHNKPNYVLFRTVKYLMDNKSIDPNGKWYILWMCMAALAVLYNCWVIPLRGTFPYQTQENRGIWMSFDYLADFVYLIDVLLIQPRVKYLQEGFWVTDVAQLRHNYVRKRAFKLDIASLIPLDILYLVWGPDVVILRFFRFFKMHTFWDFFSLIDKLLASPYFIRITRTLLYMMYLIHLNACAYYAFSSWQGIGSNNFVFNGKGNAYIKCFYFATKTATSIGKNPKPTLEVEYMFMTISWLMGVFVFALLIGQIRDIISTATRSKSEYRKLVDETLEYMRRLNLPQDMQRRVQLWFNYTWKTQRTLDENTIMDCLPHKMKTDIAINVHIQTLSKVQLFADCDEALLRELVLQLKSVIYLPGDTICKKGDVGKEMYIVRSGKVQVIGRSDDDVLATLCEGSVFGEISLLGIPGMNRRTADVRSQGHSNLFVLSKADLNAALSHYPEAQQLLNKKAKMLMKKNAAMEKQRRDNLVVIGNPSKQAKLLDTVMQVVPPDSKTNKLLRYGSRGKPERAANARFRCRNSLPVIETYGSMVDTRVQMTKVTVHRTMS